jgi:hypothetical protein
MTLSTSASGAPFMYVLETYSLACAFVLKVDSVDLNIKLGIIVRT